jgi:sialic acid synthase SpsE
VPAYLETAFVVSSRFTRFIVELSASLVRNWYSDHAASVEPQGFQRLVRDIRDVEIAAGDGIKKVYESELGPMKRLRVNIGDEYKEKPLV